MTRSLLVPLLVLLAAPATAEVDASLRTSQADAERLADAVEALRGGDCEPLDVVVDLGGRFVDASYQLAMLFAEGVCVEQDLPRAIDLSTWNCERQGDADSCNFLARQMLSEGSPASLTLAVPYARLGAYEGHAPSMQSLGWLYAARNGPYYDIDAAIYWYHRAAEDGLAAPMYNLFFLYASPGVRHAPDKAREWLERAAEAGSTSAYIALARHYESGSPLYERDTKKAVFWREKFRSTGADASRIQTPGLSRQ